MMIKVCFKCGAEKPLTEFYKHPKMSDGHVNKCKECNKKDVRDNRAAKVDYYRSYDADRYKCDPSVRVRLTMVAKRWRMENPDGYRAHTAVSNAVRDGRLKKQPCEMCGTINNLHAHHDDYGRPLDVIWLCAEHHSMRHRVSRQ